MMHNALISKFPDYKQGDWELQDDSDGDGPYIAEWNRSDKQPTKAELDLLMANYVEPVVMPVLTPWQIRQGLNIVGKRQQVEALVAGGDIELRDAWQFANEFKRDNPIIVASAPLIGLPDAQVDDLFKWFATLQPA